MKAAPFPGSLNYSSSPQQFLSKIKQLQFMALFIINPLILRYRTECDPAVLVSQLQQDRLTLFIVLCFVSFDDFSQFNRNFLKPAFADFIVPADGISASAEVGKALIRAVIQ